VAQGVRRKSLSGRFSHQANAIEAFFTKLVRERERSAMAGTWMRGCIVGHYAPWSAKQVVERATIARKAQKQDGCSPILPVDQPQNNREHDADQDSGGNRSIEREVLMLDQYVTGQSAKPDP